MFMLTQLAFFAFSLFPTCEPIDVGKYYYTKYIYTKYIYILIKIVDFSFECGQ